jgi:transcriptional regulator with XRE-family HTH domain
MTGATGPHSASAAEPREPFDFAKLSKRLQFIRVEKGWNQGDMARVVGVSQSSISLLENQRFTNPPVNLLYKIAEEAGVSKAYIMLLTDDPQGDCQGAVDGEISQQEARLLTAFRSLGDALRDATLEVVQRIASIGIAKEKEGDPSVQFSVEKTEHDG